MSEVQLILSPEQAVQEEQIKKAAARKAGLPFGAVSICRIKHKAIDARQRQIKVQLTVELFLDGENPTQAYEPPHYQNVHQAQRRVVVVGSGPAGLFAALQLLEDGIKPIVLERGRCVADRKRDIALLNRTGAFNDESNYCFGEGGAGTFSDGKLYTRSNKRGNVHRIFELFHYHGAQDSILYEAHPHIGSDVLPRVVQHMRKTITDCGGEYYFGQQVVELLLDGDRCTGVKTADGSSWTADAVILATGHSAHDSYEMLHRQGICLEAKGFAMGVRAEHPQALVDQIQYDKTGRRMGDYHRPDYLPAASYSVVAQSQGRGVYSFCMCPGGMIVPATSSSQLQVVNGMSGSHRSSPFANSGIVVEMHPEDLPREFQRYGVLAGLRWQAYVEQLARQEAFGMQAPAQRLADFVAGNHSQSLGRCSYQPGMVSSDLHQWLPPVVAQRLQDGFRQFDRRLHGYLTNEALVLGVESRSSSPLRIPRDRETLQHVQIRGLYPAGEGAGYAGGITSSAMDGIRCAMMLNADNR